MDDSVDKKVGGKRRENGVSKNESTDGSTLDNVEIYD
jgi:hypothetical protein